jgi:hypothetical protein
MKRYEPYAHDDQGLGMEEDIDGEWVKYTEVVKLTDKYQSKMDNDLADHLVNDKDNRFHGTSVAKSLRDISGMTLSVYLEVQKICEGLQRERAFTQVTKERYRMLCDELVALVEEHN